MVSEEVRSSESAIIFDSSSLNAFASAQRMQVLRSLCSARRSVTTRAVLDELRSGPNRDVDLSWLEVVPVDRLEELRRVLEYASTLGSGAKDLGETTVLAWAETYGAVAILDDEVAKKSGIRRGVRCHGTLWLIVEGVKCELLDWAEASALVDVLRDTNARFPCDGATLFDWASQQGLTD